MKKPVVINCKGDDWKPALKLTLQGDLEADLVDFDYTTGGALCETLAIAHKMDFRLNAKDSTASFRKRVWNPVARGTILQRDFNAKAEAKKSRL